MILAIRLRRATLFFVGVAFAARVGGSIAIATAAAVIAVACAFLLFILVTLEAPR